MDPADNWGPAKPEQAWPEADQAMLWMCEGLNCALNKALRILGPELVVGVASNVAPLLKDMITDSLTELLRGAAGPPCQHLTGGSPGP